MENLLGGIEAGGTHFVCAVGNSPENIKDQTSFLTTTPRKTMETVINFFRPHKNITGIGIGSFGPVDLDKNSSTYGMITTTPKKDWRNVNILEITKSSLDIPVNIDTDVNAALLAEHKWGNAKNKDNVIYITVGTGIGGGAILNGKLIHGLSHPEMGHMKIPRNSNDNFEGVCEYHRDCLEGLASGKALEKRLKENITNHDKTIWEFESQYLGIAISNLILSMSPQRIVLGGGVLNHEGLIDDVRIQTLKSLNNYVYMDEIISDIDSYILPPYLGDNAGVLGAILLAK